MRVKLLVLLLFVPGLSWGQSAQVWKDRGMRSLTLENYTQAVEDFRSALRVNPNYLEAHEGLVQAFFALGEYDEAGRAVTEAVRLGSGQSRVKVLQGRVLLGQGKYEEGFKLFQEVLAREPRNTGAFFGRGEYYVLTGKYLQAQREYKEILKAEPDSLRAHLALIILALHQGRVTEVPPFLNPILRNHSADPLTHWWAAQYWYRKGDLTQALGALDNWLQLKKTAQTPPAKGALNKGLIFRAVLLMKMGRPGEAVTTVTQAVSEDPNGGYGWYIKGLGEFADGQVDNALGSFSRVLAIDKEDELARIALENLVLETQQVENSPIRRGLADWHFNLARGARRSSELTRAYQEFRRGLLLYPDDPRGFREMAEILKTQGFLTSYRDKLANFETRYGTDGLDTAFLDELEIQRSLYLESFPATWNLKIEDFEGQGERGDFRARLVEAGVYYISEASQLDYYSGVDQLALYFQDELSQFRGFSFLGQGSQERKPEEVPHSTAAFQKARADGLDFYILLEFREGFRDITGVAHLYLARTGRLLQSFPVYKKGLNRVAGTLRQMAKDTAAYFPLWGRLALRDKSRGLISLGVRDGVEKDQKFLILKSRSTEFTGDADFVKYSEADVLGTFTVTQTDDRISEGTLEKTGFYDLMAPGDEVLLLKQPTDPRPIVWPAFSELQRSILGLR